MSYITKIFIVSDIQRVKAVFTIYVIYTLDSCVREYNSNMCFFLIWLGIVVDHPQWLGMVVAHTQPSGTFMICLWLVPIFNNIYIARNPSPPPPPPPDYLLQRRGLKKWGGRGCKYDTGTSVFKRRRLALFLFSFFTFTFRNYFILCQMCYVFEEKLLFYATIILWKKLILSCLKINWKISHKLI